jgi:hypothetical protein
MLYAGECLVIVIPYYQIIFRFLILRNPFISQPDNLIFFIQRSLNLLANPIGFEIINAAKLFLFLFYNCIMTTKLLLFSNHRLSPTSVYAIYL